MKEQFDTKHMIHYADSRNLLCLEDDSVHLMITSPPYPMISMWDDLFRTFSPEIGEALDNEDGNSAFELMNRELDQVWSEVFRVLKPGCIACINIGDATRRIGETFRLYPSHSRITQKCVELGFDVLPEILWRKPNNSPTKFLGSGMLPGGAYVTLEHEFILVFRKPEKRNYKSPEEKSLRYESAYFWEERNSWFSDIWNFIGVRQAMDQKEIRSRSAAFPLEVPRRLISMFSNRGDTVLDPFLGTGTTMLAALGAGRNSIGIELDPGFHDLISEDIKNQPEIVNTSIDERISEHLRFIEDREKNNKPVKHKNDFYGFPVMTLQEKKILFYYIDSISQVDQGIFKACHRLKQGASDGE